MTKNVNYNLIKLLHCKLDTIWRLEKFYCDDSQQENCPSAEALKKILADERQHAQILRDEIKRRVEAGVFD